MFRSRKTLTAFFAALLLTAMQLHSMLHWFGHGHEEAAGGEPCALCVQVLHQQALESAGPVQAPVAILGFELPQIATVSFHPQYRCFTPALRGPPEPLQTV